MPLGQGLCTWIAIGTALACLCLPAAALEPTCQPDKYGGQPASSANTLFITEFHISDAAPVDLCPRGGAYYKREGHLLRGQRLPIHFWFRLQGDRSLIDAVTGRGINSLRLKAIFQQNIVEDTYAPLEGVAGDAIMLDQPLPLPVVRGEAMGNERAANAVTEAGLGLFDWRMDFAKRSGLSEHGGFRVKLAVDRQDAILIACGLSIGCQVDESRSAWIAFIR